MKWNASFNHKKIHPLVTQVILFIDLPKREHINSLKKWINMRILKCKLRAGIHLKVIVVTHY